jgi:hypothetical protein
MVRKTLKILVVALVAVFTLSSTAEAAAPKNTRHRTKHSSRVASGAPVPAGKKPAAKKKASASQTRAKAGSTAKKNAPAVRPPTTKPR